MLQAEHPDRDLRTQHTPEQVISVLSGQVQVLCSRAVMAEFHGGQGQLRNRCYLNQQGKQEELNSAGKASRTVTVHPGLQDQLTCLRLRQYWQEPPRPEPTDQEDRTRG